MRNVLLHLFNSFRIANNRFQFPISALQFRCLRKDSALTVCTEQNPFRQSNNQFPIPEITHLLCNQKVYQSHFNSPPVDFILSHTSALNTLSPPLTSRFNIIPVSTTRHCESFFPLQFLINYCYACLISSTHVTASFLLLYALFWVIPRRLKFICRRFGTLSLFHLVNYFQK
jgi:hypothetical protein